MDHFDNPTRQAIVLALKKKGNLSVDELSKEVKITPMGVRQHLLVLERNGMVEYITRKQGIGRPGFLYRLTSATDAFFPKTYEQFSLDLLRQIERADGRSKIEELLKARKDHILAERLKTFTGKDSLAGRVSALVDMMHEAGGITELEEDETHYKVRQFNCPLSKIASQYKEVCTYDTELFQTLLGVDITLQESIADGARSCSYLIPKE
ncbi:MAG TPA: ArsR family transcriptional regulator [Thermodesulfovibrionales bacterium]|nr:ArsR family transcriptional regulator [Thermodesulfovibrionales bacterium]